MALASLRRELSFRNVIYLIRQKETGKPYVGQTRETAWRRWSAHRNKALAANDQSYSCQTAISRAMRKHGVDAFEFLILERCSNPDTLDARETFWIGEFGSLVPFGYNLTTGGNNSTRSAEVGRKISTANKGRVKTSEWRAKLSAAHKGKRLSVEQRAHISAIQKGRPQTAEANEKRRLSMLGKNTGPRSQMVCAAISAGMTEVGKARSRAAHIGAKRSEKTKQRLREAWVRRKVRENGAATQTS